jgi:hypothetical protein
MLCLITSLIGGSEVEKRSAGKKKKKAYPRPAVVSSEDLLVTPRLFPAVPSVHVIEGEVTRLWSRSSRSS